MKTRPLKTFLLGSGLVLRHEDRIRDLLKKGSISVNDEVQGLEDFEKPLKINDVVSVSNCVSITVKE